MDLSPLFLRLARGLVAVMVMTALAVGAVTAATASEPSPTGAASEGDSHPSEAPVEVPTAPTVEELGGLFPTTSWAAVGAIAGAAVGWRLSRRRMRTQSVARRPFLPLRPATAPTRDRAPSAAPETAAAAPNEGWPPTDHVVDELIEGLIASHDLASSDGQRARLAATLRRAAVTIVEPSSGEPFDPQRHRALAWEPAPSPAHRAHVARTERPGWSRDGAILRHPEVIVWQ